MSDEKESSGMIQLSGLWKQESRSGKTYYSGSLGPSVQLQLWSNKFKEEGDKRPDLILYIVKREPKKKPAEVRSTPGEDVPF